MVKNKVVTNKIPELVVLGRRIQKLRNDMGVTQEQFAPMAKLDRSFYAGVESGTRNPSYLTLKGISDALGISFSDLLSNL